MTVSLSRVSSRRWAVPATGSPVSNLEFNGHKRKSEIAPMAHSRSIDEIINQLSQQHAEQLDELAGDLHDGLLQYVIAAHMSTEALRRKLSSSSAELPGEVESIQQYLQQAIAEGRRLLAGMQMEAVGVTDIGAALQHLGDELTRDGIRCKVDLPPSVDVDTSTSTVLVRLAQEAISNIRRHSRAASVQVSLRVVADGVELEVTDDGVGFQAVDNDSGGFGLSSMRRRVAAAGGTLQLDTAPERGTRITVRLPRQN